MIEKEKLKKISGNLLSDRNDYMNAFRENLFMYVGDSDITIKDISEKADIPFSTLNSLLYGKTNDPKLSTVVKLAHALEVSVDELIGAETIKGKTQESLSICRNLPKNDIYLIRWFIRYLESLNAEVAPNNRTVSVMVLTLTDNGDVRLTSDYMKVDISELNKGFSTKIFFGVVLSCDYYMPYYTPYDILFIANDRKPKIKEHCLIRAGKYVYLATRRIENGLPCYYSIRDGKYRANENDIDELIGYVCYHKPLNE